MSAPAGDRQAVVARNFPAAWVLPSALEGLPSKVQSLLQRIGPLEGAPVISQGPAGLQALARFQTLDAASDAVRTLNGVDLRTPKEKQAANFADPKPSECFWLKVASDVNPSELAPAAGVAAAGPAQAAAALPARPGLAAAPASPPRRRMIIPTGVVLQPLPASWGEEDVKQMASSYGDVLRVRLEKLPNGQKGALIDYRLDTAASAALGGLNGLAIMGQRLVCRMQEAPEPARPTRQVLVFLDELAAALPDNEAELEPRLDDRELFIAGLPDTVRKEDTTRAWLASFGEVEEVFLVKDVQHKATGKAYARFRNYIEAQKAHTAIRAASTDGSLQVSWSESERALRGTKGSYGLDVCRRICGEGGARLREIRQAAGAVGLTFGGSGADSDGKTPSQVHFVIRCEKSSQAEECIKLLEAELAKVRETYAREVRGSLVLSGFAASWSEKGLKFVFAPFGGIASVAMEEEQGSAASAEGGAATSPVRLAYVKLRNEASTEKAVTNLDQTKVGDGDLVEECVVACHRWHLRAWSDGSFQVPIFIDQLPMTRRPPEAIAEPGAEDRELFVQNLPLQDMNRQQLQEYFEGFGEVEDLHLIRNTFTGEPRNEGYVRFRHHRDAKRCIEALTPTNPQEADPSDLTGSWSESERALQRKANCYRFNLVAELVGADGSGLENLKKEAKLKGLWVLAETLQQKDRSTPPSWGRQLHFMARCTDEAHGRLFRQLLERALEDTHAKITSRIEKRNKKEAAAAAGESLEKVGAPPAAPTPDPEAGKNGQAPQAEGPWRPPVGGPPPSGGAAAWPPPNYWTGAPHAGGWPGQAPSGPWAAGPPPAATMAPAPQVSVFEQRQPPSRPQDALAPEGQGKERRSRSRRRRHRGGGAGAEGGPEKEKKHRSKSHKRRRHREPGEE
mmetsp:Transcript_94143/g.210457  ORF Transcript_94143/g.210457 Transcript_94143/m.210457 type:complete len:906 (-) Transcript_94143:158-2875(-)